MADPAAHLTYAELDSPRRLRADGAAVERALRLGPPSLEYDAFPREVVKRDIEVTEAAARIAKALGLLVE